MNVQQTILKGIRGRLFNHDYLVIPGFGGFVLKPYPSQFSAGGTQLLPPSKTVSFNSQLKQNDGVLAQWMQKEMKCSAAEALRHLAEFTEYCSSILQTRRRLNFEGVGFFFLDFENNVCFEPQHEQNFLASSFGLEPVSLRPLAVNPAPPKEIVSFVDRTGSLAQETEQKQKRYNVRQLAAVFGVFALLSLFIVLIAGNTFSRGYLTASVFDPESASSYVPLHYEKIELRRAAPSINAYVADANGVAHIRMGDKTLAVQVIDSRETEGHVTLNSGNFEMVFGCFTVRQNADRLIRKLRKKNITASISGTNSRGMFVVSSGNFSDKDIAVQHLSHIKDLYPNTWIRQKN